MRPTRRLATSGLAASLLLAGCGGGQTRPSPVVTPTPTPTPTPLPTPVTTCSPLPPPVTRWKLKATFRFPDYQIVDATPFVGPNAEYCARVGYTDGRSICTVRPEGDPQRSECEGYAVGKAKDTGRPGPTWTRNGALCTGAPSGCQNSPDNQFQVRAYLNGKYEACATNGACGDLDHER